MIPDLVGSCNYAPAKSNAQPQTTIPVSARKRNAHTQFEAR
jgi:hypothetical protein